MIEHGRYQIDHLPRENRLCPLCNSNQVEDEIHFLFQCNKYSVQRQAFINQINRIIPDFDKKSSPESIKLIMNSKEHHVNKLVMKFVSSCMKIRDSLFAPKRCKLGTEDELEPSTPQTLTTQQN